MFSVHLKFTLVHDDPNAQRAVTFESTLRPMHMKIYFNLKIMNFIPFALNLISYYVENFTFTALAPFNRFFFARDGNYLCTT